MGSTFQRGSTAAQDAPSTLDALKERHGLLERLSRIQRSISHGAPLDEVLSAIAAGASEVLGDPVAGLRLVAGDDPTRMTLVAATGLTPDEAVAVRDARVGEGAGGRAIAEGRVVVLEDYPATGDGIAAFGALGVQNALAAPIRVKGRVVGSLTVASFEPGRRYGALEEEILSALAEHAGLALLDAKLIDARERLVERQGEERFQALVRHSSDLIAIVDEQGTISYATPSVGRTLGQAPEALAGTPLLAHVHPADRPAAEALLREVALGAGTAPAADWRLVPPGADEDPDRWLHVEVLATNLLEHPSVRGIVLNARDVTERARADARYRQVVDTTHDGVWMVDAEDRTVFANAALARMLGCEERELLGKRPADFATPEQAEVVQAAMARRRRGLHERYEATLRRADGSPLHLEISATPMFDGDRFVGALALCADVTELVGARREKAQLETRLRQAQSFETLGTLAGQVAHDFNQVLSVILGYATLMASRTEDERTREDLGHLVAAAEHGAALARQLVQFSRRDEGEPEVLDLGAAVEAVGRMVRRAAPGGVQVQARTAPRPLPVRIDPTKLRQVVMNLVDNATDAIGPDGVGVIELATEEVLIADEPALGVAPGCYAQLTVADTGSGMSPEVVARALEPAYTTKPSGSGSGLGLSIAHGIVQQAGGHVGLRSVVGRGTTVRVLLPLAEEPFAEPEPEPELAPAEDGPAAPPVGARTARILLVEDDRGVLELTRRVLAERGHVVRACGTAEEAFAVAREERFDLLLTDHALPGSSGVELARALAASAPGMPAIVMSGYASEVSAGDPAGVSWLAKPFGAATLLGAVDAALGG